MSFVRILEKIDHVIMAPHCIMFLIQTATSHMCLHECLCGICIVVVMCTIECGGVQTVLCQGNIYM